MTQPISVLVCALGGEGGGVLSEWLMDTSRRAGYPAQSTSIPGVAQRTGATTYYIEVLPTPLSELNGKQPVFSLNPVPGALDALVSTELLETARQISLGMVSADRTRVFSSSSRSLTTLERMPMGDGRLDTQPLLDLVKQFSHESQVWDFSAMAKEQGTMVSAVMLGVIAASGVFPMAREHYEATIGTGGSSAASLRGFAAAFERVHNTLAVQAMLADDEVSKKPLPLDEEPALAVFPANVRELATLGFARLCDYQHRNYAMRYVQRLQQVLDAENAVDPTHVNGQAASREAARWLALWMAFDDIVRVADLKSRDSRRQRVALEVKQQDGELLRVYEHFKPGVPEFAALLPAWLAAPVLRFDKARVLKGREPLALPLKIGSHSVSGMLALRMLAGLKWLRPFGSRFAVEQHDIEQWLDAVCIGLREHHGLGLQLALCGRLIKGYGSTNERAKRNLQHILQHLAPASVNPSAPWRTDAVRQAREAALTDEAGLALDSKLQALGVAKRTPIEQPLRFIRSAGRSKPD
jgi:indolepyruvate ferredoxin oxidoreductase beta subunit